ncbi:MAG TPA: hypothetical protein VJ965_03125 [Anaerolineales bacterium]|nr:hypothetical protein [Anaerolineales bacterium]
MAPVVHGLENKYGESMNFVYIDIDDPQTEPLRKELGFLRSWRPYFFFLDSSGEIVGPTLIGVQSGETLEQAVIDVLVQDGVIKN